MSNIARLMFSFLAQNLNKPEQPESKLTLYNMKMLSFSYNLQNASQIAPLQNRTRQYTPTFIKIAPTFRANQSLLFLLNTTCLTEKQQIPIQFYLIWAQMHDLPHSGESTLNITPPMRLIFQLKHHKDTQNMKDIMHKDYQTDLQTIISPTTSG